MTIEEIDAATNAIFALVTKDMEPDEFDPDKLRSSIRGYAAVGLEAAEKVRGWAPSEVGPIAP